MKRNVEKILVAEQKKVKRNNHSDNKIPQKSEQNKTRPFSRRRVVLPEDEGLDPHRKGVVGMHACGVLRAREVVKAGEATLEEVGVGERGKGGRNGTATAKQGRFRGRDVLHSHRNSCGRHAAQRSSEIRGI
jgi:hypothetical protein